MAVVDIATLKTYFNTGDKPTESQYHDFIDTMFDQAGGGGSEAEDALTVGDFISKVARIGGTAFSLANTGSGQYTYTAQTGASCQRIDIDGDENVLNNGTLIVKFDNSTNSRERWFDVGLVNKENDSQVDMRLGANTYTQVVSGYITTLTIPGLNNYQTAGFKLMLR